VIMKWIKLFEGFEQATKIKWLNDNFLYFKIIEDLKGLQMIETKSNIYFYEESYNQKTLKFIYCKKNPLGAQSQTLLCSSGARENYFARSLGISPYTLADSKLYYSFKEIYNKALKDFFSKYIDAAFLIKDVYNWDRWGDRFNLVIDSQ